MKKLFLFVAVVISALSAIASDQFYVIMKDGSAESFPSEKVDSITFDDPQIANAKGFNDLMFEIEKLKKEIEMLKSNGGGNAFLSSTSGSIDGYEYVDLGLPSGLKWATCNVGATKPMEYGDHFAWGEVKAKESYDSDNSLTYNKSREVLELDSIIDESGNLTAKYDAASQNWGGKWRMPTVTEFKELLNNCKWYWVTMTDSYGIGISGYKVVSKKDVTKWIFLPAAGYRTSTSGDDVGSYGTYWSSTVHESNYAYYLLFYSGSKNTHYNFHCDGHTVRPVTE